MDQRRAVSAVILLLWITCAHGLAAEPRQALRTDAAQADRVVELPGAKAEDLDFGLFAGYVTVDDDAGRALFYVLAESQANPGTDPLVLWLNGGPGCSSLGGGFWSELGPFYPTPGGKELTRNKYAWNRVSNVVFVESPAFVGFSYSNSSVDKVVGDYRTSRDLVQFLDGFMDRFPEYKGRPFWITGESYGGHYVPNLAAALIEAKQGSQGRNIVSINLQGFLVGNAWTDSALDNGGAVDSWYAHAIVSADLQQGIHRYCQMDAVGPLKAAQRPASTVVERLWRLLSDLLGWADEKDPEKCQRYVGRIPSEMGNINIYQIYADVCLPGRSSARQLGKLIPNTPIGAAINAAHANTAVDPCIDSEVELYANRPEVQKALHANISGMLPWRWTDCSPQVQYNFTDLFSSELPVYRKLLATTPPLKILVYSGDVDGIVPVLGTRRWIEKLDLPIVRKWRPWYSSTGQVGGYVTVHEGLIFSTVRNAGHMVPYGQPERAFWLFSRTIAGKSL